MTVDLDALEALRSRLRHIEAIARMLSAASERGDPMHAIEGVAVTLEEQGERLDAIINAVAADQRT